MWVIASADTRKMLRSRTTYFGAVMLMVSSSSYFLAYNKILNSLIKQSATSQLINEASRNYLSTTFYIWPLIYCLMAGAIGANGFVLEKTGRNLEPLLVTPLGVIQIWVGKVLALTIVSVITGLAVSLIMFLGISFGLVIPKTHNFVAPGAVAIVTALVIVPVLTFTVMLLTSYIQLVTTNARAANAIVIFVFIGMWVGLAFVTYDLPNAPNYYTPIYSGLIVVFGLVSRLLSGSLTPEKVVLSSKG